MKKLALTLVAIALSSSAFAGQLSLVCRTGDIADMDVKVETVSGNEKVSVILTGMDGETVRTYTNSHIEGEAFTKALGTGTTVEAVVSKSDLADQFGGAYLDAGILKMTRDSKANGYVTTFAAEGNVLEAFCY